MKTRLLALTKCSVRQFFIMVGLCCDIPRTCVLNQDKKERWDGCVAKNVKSNNNSG